MSREAFVNQIRPIIAKKLNERGYNINVLDAIVAQACVESGNGESLLATRYHNYFGMKCGSFWQGKSVNLATKEEYNGNIQNIRDNFRVYNSLEEGVAGYFDFISTARYSNLSKCTDPKLYLETIKLCGYATASNYVDTCMHVVNQISKPEKVIQTPVEYKVGNNYTLLVNLNVRETPALSGRRKSHNELTVDGQRHDKDKNGSLDSGTVITCKDVKVVDGNIWLLCPSGWVCGTQGNCIYIK